MYRITTLLSIKATIKKITELILFVTGFHWNAAVSVKVWRLHIVSKSLLLIKCINILVLIVNLKENSMW